DHLDLHGDMETYFAAKAGLAGLLRRDPPGRRVIGIDDAMIRRLAATPRPGDVTFGTAKDALVRANDVHASLTGTVFSLVTPAGSVTVSLPLIGRHNLENALAAAAAAFALGWNLDTIATALGAAAPVAGRLEPVDIGRPCQVFVDYAHTPDALQQVLLAIRELAPERRLIVVFGCGGDKDTGKRAPMGEIVARIADVPIVTSDNPRSEDPQAIIDEVLIGVQRVGNPRILAIADRREAIAAALAVADDHSVIILAGKGHEQEQIFADHTVPFDDRVVVCELARRRRG
ncbi:MAG: UDP-N-acetylmuramyl-tripeptide synthetase, partial [Acidobacteria bacterium]|nr:UDP-N-acetylmuramyl-tripeptide synthetase [Acidobacteriota bacterium]